jgi:hypothetical protein
MQGDQHPFGGPHIPQAPVKKTRDYKDLTVKTFAVIGIVAVLGAGTFFTISAAKYTGPALSRIVAAAVSLTSIFIPRGAQNLELTVPSPNINSGETVALSWTPVAESGTYSLNYPCVDGFHFETTLASGMKHSLSCNQLFEVTSGISSVVLVPVSEKNRYVDMPITLSFTPTGNTNPSVSGLVTITVSNLAIANSSQYVNEQTGNNGGGGSSNTAATPSPVAPTTPTTPSKPTPTPGTPTSQVYTYPVGTTAVTENPNGKADLKVTILATGVVDKLTGAFATTTDLKRSDRIGVKFAVENAGDKSSGQWKFNAILPTFPPFTFNSDYQQTLAPGDRIEFTIGFDQAVAGTQEVKFVLDPQQFVAESNEANNTTTINITVQ